MLPSGPDQQGNEKRQGDHSGQFVFKEPQHGTRCSFCDEQQDQPADSAANDSPHWRRKVWLIDYARFDAAETELIFSALFDQDVNDIVYGDDAQEPVIPNDRHRHEIVVSNQLAAISWSSVGATEMTLVVINSRNVFLGGQNNLSQ